MEGGEEGAEAITKADSQWALMPRCSHYAAILEIDVGELRVLDIAAAVVVPGASTAVAVAVAAAAGHSIRVVAGTRNCPRQYGPADEPPTREWVAAKTAVDRDTAKIPNCYTQTPRRILSADTHPLLLHVYSIVATRPRMLKPIKKVLLLHTLSISFLLELLALHSSNVRLHSGKLGRMRAKYRVLYVWYTESVRQETGNLLCRFVYGR